MGYPLQVQVWVYPWVEFSQPVAVPIPTPRVWGNWKVRVWVTVKNTQGYCVPITTPKVWKSCSWDLLPSGFLPFSSSEHELLEFTNTFQPKIEYTDANP